MKFDERPRKAIGHLLYFISNFVHHFIAISELKQESEPGNAQFGLKSAIFVTCDIEIWQMTLVNNRASLLCCLKLCASFHSHQSIQTGVIVWKRTIWIKIFDFFVLCDLVIWLMTLKTIEQLVHVASSSVHHFTVIGEFKLVLQTGNAQFGSKSTNFVAVCPWNLTDDCEKQ